MEAQSEIIGLKFDGNGIKPSAVKASEIADLIKNFEFAVSEVLQVEQQDYSETFVYLSFDEIKENCLTLKLKTHRAAVLAAYLTITTAFQTNNFNNLPKDSLEKLRSFIRFTKKYNCSGTFTQNGDSITTFSKTTDIKYRDEEFLWGETTIFGEIRKAGGDNPRVNFIVNNDYPINFDVEKDFAIELAKNLYKNASLKGRAKWDKNTYRVLDFKAESVNYIENVSLTDTFETLQNLFSNHFQNFNDVI